jgi:hypothetical protein
MKKILSLTLVFLIIFMIGAIAVFADGELATDINSEALGDSISAGSTPTVEVQDNSKFDKMLEGITNSTFWTTMGTVLAAVVGMLAMFKKHFGNISTLISGKADTKAVNSALKDASAEISKDFCDKLDKLEAKLAEADNDEKKLMAMFTIFAANANINPNAKAEIMKYLTGIKDISGKVIDVVETANKIIAEANAAEEQLPTPALDAITEEKSEGGMLLD